MNDATNRAPDFEPERVLFHGGGLLVIDKPAGIPVHRGTDHPFGVVEVIEQWVRMHPGALDVRAGRSIHPIHRLEREASGVLVLGLQRAQARQVKDLFSAGEIDREYLAVVAGPVDDVGTIRGRVRSKLRGVYRRVEAQITYSRLAGDERLSLVRVWPRGGRTHQLRALFAGADRPLAGDLRYGKPKPGKQFLARFSVPHFLLHAAALTLPPAVLGAERTFRAPLPAIFEQLCRQKGWDEASAALGDGPTESQ